MIKMMHMRRVCVVVSDSLGRVFHIFPSWPFSFPQISVNELEPEIAAATDCKIVTYNKGLWVIPSPKTRPAARRQRCQRVKTMVNLAVLSGEQLAYVYREGG